jgi:hypothetical protein
MRYIDDQAIEEGVRAKEILSETEDIIYDLCDLDYQKGEMKLREGVTVEDFISGISMAICGYASKWEACRRLKKQEEVA